MASAWHANVASVFVIGLLKTSRPVSLLSVGCKLFHHLAAEAEARWGGEAHLQIAVRVQVWPWHGRRAVHGQEDGQADRLGSGRRTRLAPCLDSRTRLREFIRPSVAPPRNALIRSDSPLSEKSHILSWCLGIWFPLAHFWQEPPYECAEWSSSGHSHH